jgi:hypothetical protein
MPGQGPVDALAAAVGLDHRTRQFLDEQRDAVAALDDLWRELLRQCPVAGDSPDHFGAGARVEAAQGQGPHLWLAAPWRLEFGSKGQNQRHRQAFRSVYEQIEQFARAGSIQCRSSNTISTGWRRARSVSFRSTAREGLLLLALPAELQRRISVSPAMTSNRPTVPSRAAMRSARAALRACSAAYRPCRRARNRRRVRAGR